MTDKRVSFRTFPASAFPFTVTFIDHETPRGLGPDE